MTPLQTALKYPIQISEEKKKQSKKRDKKNVTASHLVMKIILFNEWWVNTSDSLQKKKDLKMKMYFQHKWSFVITQQYWYQKRGFNTYKSTLAIQPQKVHTQPNGLQQTLVRWVRRRSIIAECVLFVLELSAILSTLSVVATNSEIWFRTVAVTYMPFSFTNPWSALPLHSLLKEPMCFSQKNS